MTTTPLQRAARAFRQALDEETEAKQAVDIARARRKAAAGKVDKARAPLAEAIVKAARSGKRQVDILDEIEHVYTRESVRRICVAAGLRETRE